MFVDICCRWKLATPLYCRGLSKQEFNGAEGKIIGPEADGGRFPVQLDGSQKLVRAKPENIHLKKNEKEAISIFADRLAELGNPINELTPAQGPAEMQGPSCGASPEMLESSPEMLESLLADCLAELGNPIKFGVYRINEPTPAQDIVIIK